MARSKAGPSVMKLRSKRRAAGSRYVPAHCVTRQTDKNLHDYGQAYNDARIWAKGQPSDLVRHERAVVRSQAAEDAQAQPATAIGMAAIALLLSLGNAATQGSGIVSYLPTIGFAVLLLTWIAFRLTYRSGQSEALIQAFTDVLDERDRRASDSRKQRRRRERLEKSTQ